MKLYVAVTCRDIYTCLKTKLVYIAMHTTPHTYQRERKSLTIAASVLLK